VPWRCLARSFARAGVGFGIACFALNVACGGAAPATASAASAVDSLPSGTGSATSAIPPRKPDGVVLETPATVPTPLVHGSADGVVSLREPAAQDAVVELVDAFFDGWQRESLDSLLALAAPDAGLLDGPDHGHATLVDSWRQRLRAHDYGRLAGAEIVSPERIERWQWDELGTPPMPARPSGMRPGEILVRAPLEVTRVAGERVFGDVVVMVLRRQDGALRIAAYGEGDAP
jgi:hypothetical protein